MPDFSKLLDRHSARFRGAAARRAAGHAGRRRPSTPAKREALLRRVFLEGDPYTDLIFNVPEAEQLSAPWSRFAADLNRERDDESDNGVLKHV